MTKKKRERAHERSVLTNTIIEKRMGGGWRRYVKLFIDDIIIYRLRLSIYRVMHDNGTFTKVTFIFNVNLR